MLIINERLKPFYSEDENLGLATGGALTGDLEDAFYNKKLTSSDFSNLLDSYGIPHGDIVSGTCEYTDYWLWESDPVYHFKDSNGNYYEINYVGSFENNCLGETEITVSPPQGGYTTYHILDEGEDGEIYVSSIDIGGVKSSTTTKVLENGKRCQEIVERNLKGELLKCVFVENGDGTISLTYYMADNKTKEYVEIGQETYTGDLSDSKNKAYSLQAELLYKKEQPLNYALAGIHSGNIGGFGKGDALVDRLFYNSSSLAEAYLDALNVIEKTNEITAAAKSYCNRIDGQNITNFSGLITNVKNSFNCSSSKLPNSGMDSCLSDSLKDFKVIMQNAVDLNYKLEHSNINAFDEGSVNGDDISVKFTDSKGNTYTSYSEYLEVCSETVTKRNSETSVDYHYYEGSRDYVPYYAKTTVKGKVLGRDAEYTNEIKGSNFTKKDVSKVNASITAGDLEKLFTGDLSSVSSEIEYGMEGEFVFYSNKSDFKIYNRDGSIYSHDVAGIDVGKIKLEGTVKLSPTSVQLHGKVEGTLLNFNIGHYVDSSDSLNYAIDLNLVQLGGEANLKFGTNILESVLSAKARDKIFSGKVSSSSDLEKLDLADTDSLFKMDAGFDYKFYGRAANIKAKFSWKTDSSKSIGVESEANFLGFEISNKVKKGYYVDWDPRKTKIKFNIDGEQFIEDAYKDYYLRKGVII